MGSEGWVVPLYLCLSQSTHHQLLPLLLSNCFSVPVDGEVHHIHQLVLSLLTTHEPRPLHTPAQRAEGRGQRAESNEQRAESREQRAESREQRAEEDI